MKNINQTPKTLMDYSISRTLLHVSSISVVCLATNGANHFISLIAFRSFLSFSAQIAPAFSQNGSSLYSISIQVTTLFADIYGNNLENEESLFEFPFIHK